LKSYGSQRVSQVFDDVVYPGSWADDGYVVEVCRYMNFVVCVLVEGADGVA
jgi:hypothetical protein